jgi:hypothetical protein
MNTKLSTAALGITVTLALGVSLAACSGSQSEEEAAPSSAQGEQQGGPGGPGGGMPGGMPGSGKIADVSGSTAQVQGMESQVSVSWTDSTVFTQQVSGGLSDVEVGVCVMVMANQASEDDSAAIQAASVQVTQPVDGECAPGGPGGRERPAAMPTDRRTDVPDGAPERGPGGRPGGFVMGKVTSVQADGFAVEGRMPGEQDAEASTTQVAVTSSTAFTATRAAKASDVKVGMCMTSRGESDDTGALVAEAITLSTATDGECQMGFGRRPGGSERGGNA